MNIRMLLRNFLLDAQFYGRVVGTIGAMTVLSACVTIDYGQSVDVSGLDNLEVKTSGKADVLLELGEPRGKGGAEFARQQGQPRDIWFYEHTRSDGSEVNLFLLVVFRSAAALPVAARVALW